MLIKSMNFECSFDKGNQSSCKKVLIVIILMILMSFIALSSLRLALFNAIYLNNHYKSIHLLSIHQGIISSSSFSFPFFSLLNNVWVVPESDNSILNIF